MSESDSVCRCLKIRVKDLISPEWLERVKVTYRRTVQAVMLLLLVAVHWRQVVVPTQVISAAASSLTCSPGCWRITQSTAYPPLMLCSTPTSKRSVAITPHPNRAQICLQHEAKHNRSSILVRLRVRLTMSICVDAGATARTERVHPQWAAAGAVPQAQQAWASGRKHAPGGATQHL